MAEHVENALVGVSPPVLLESTAKRLIEAIAGRGGVESICQFLDQLDWLPDEAKQLRLKIKLNTVFFEASLSISSREMIKRPYGVRYREISEFMGVSCPSCGFHTAYSMARDSKGFCPSCRCRLKPTYMLALRELAKTKKVKPSPEAVLMYYAYDLLGQAYVDAYKVLSVALDSLAQLFGWKRFHVDHRLLNYMHSYFYGRLAGEQKISREEKECLQFMVRGNLARIPFEEAETLLRTGVDVVKYGYLFEVLKTVGAQVHYLQAASAFGMLYDSINKTIRETLHASAADMARKIRIKKTVKGYYVPCMKTSKASWQGGQFEGEVLLEPTALPIFPKTDMGAIQTVYGRLGCGKTFLLSSLICYSYLAKRETILIPLNDKTNSYSLAPIPMFPYSRGTAKLMRLLQMLDVEPQGIPTITINALRKGEKIDDLNRHPPTIYDRIVYVDNPTSFTLNFNELMAELQAEAEKHGYNQPVGIIAFRNLQREARNYYIDVEIASNVILEFDKWRKGHMSRPSRVVLDEVSYIAASHAVLYATDKLTAGATVTDFIKESRRNNVSVDAATQMPIEIMRELRNAATNVFFRDLSVSRDKNRSPIDFLLESIQLRDDALKPVIRDMNNRGALPKYFWFWYCQPEYNIEIIRPCPPTFSVYDPEAKMPPRQIIQEYEKQSGQQILLKSWSDVKTLSPAKPREPQKFSYKTGSY